jgi:flagellar motility protein MotE (MotC chaperone)
MIRLFRDFRLIPVVLAAAIALFTLKVLGIAFDGGYTLTGLDREAGETALNPPRTTAAASAPRGGKSWAQEMFGYPDITGAVAAKKKEGESDADKNAKAEAANKQPVEPKPGPNGTVIPLTNGGERPQSPAERAILERLTERRQELDARTRELDIRESLLKAAEKRMEAKLAELKEVEGRVASASKKREEAEAANFKSLVVMYENMKAKDAAKIFDRLEMSVLIQVASQVNPRRMSDIMAQMMPEAAERLTVELANRANGVDRSQTPADLPKIEGRPAGN